MEKINVFELEDNRLLTTKQAATFLGYSVGTVYNLVCLGILRPYRCGKGSRAVLRFLKKDLDQFLGRACNGN